MTKTNQKYDFSFIPTKIGAGVKDTLDTLENDSQYIKVAERFLSSIGEDDNAVDDVYEYLRDEEWNLGTSAKRSLIDMPSFTNQQKKDYTYLEYEERI